MQIIKVKNYQEMSDKAAKLLIEQVSLKPTSTVCFATGSTPIGMYKNLILASNNNQVDFSKMLTFNLDEYIGLAPEHSQSYQNFMHKQLFDQINVNSQNIHFPSGVGDITQNIENYNQVLENYSPLDFTILGIGTNGHIAFNEPGCDFESQTQLIDLTNETIQSNARFFDDINDVPKQAISMGIKSILNAKQIILLASGKAKAQAIYDAIKGPYTTKCPASALQVHGNVTFIIDEEAASLL